MSQCSVINGTLLEPQLTKMTLMPTAPDVVEILNCLPCPAILLAKDYQILAANNLYRELYGFSDQPKRQRCYEVSHQNTVPCDLAGEACPLKESLKTGENSRVLHIHHTPRGQEYVNVELWPVKDRNTDEVEYFIEQIYPSDVAATVSAPDRMVGRSRLFQEMLDLVERVARSTTNVLLLGESGTGKEMVAQTVHRLSDRRDEPFVPVECTGLPDTLFESELFGYVKGAFTGALANKTGLVAAAENGTLFLDEIGDIPMAEQVKLLRLLETRRYRQVGSNEWVEADFRLVCATNKDLAAMVELGTFREDLFYRINVFEIVLPPLRERIDDLELLIENIIQRLGAPDLIFAEDTLAALRNFRFTGNVRELRNIVERSVLLADDGVVHLNHLPKQLQNQTTSQVPRNSEVVTLEEAEHRYLQQVLGHHKGDRKELAEKLGISSRVLYRKLAEMREEP